MRVIVAAGAGVLLALASAPQASAKRQHTGASGNQTDTKPPVTNHAQPVEAVQPSEYYQPCRQNQRNYRSDLCAQWSAAQGAIDAAYWSKWAVFLGLMSVGGLALTWFETRKTAQAAIDAVGEAKRANAAQLRPYVYIEKVRPKPLDPTSKKFTIHVKNFGHTPAKNVITRHALCTCRPDELYCPIPETEFYSDRDIPPNHVTQTVILLPTSIGDQIPAINAGQLVLICTLIMTYDMPGIGSDMLREVFVYDKTGPRGFTRREADG